MSATAEPFSGLGMPVFTAFGWAGEEAAIQFALSQLDLFIKELHKNLSAEAQECFPHFGLDKEAKTVYISAQENPVEGVYITFNARPAALDIRMNIVDEKTLSKGLQAAEKNIPAWHRYIIQLGEEWSLHLQQSHVDEETQEVSNYQDLFKDEVTKFSLEICEEVTSRAAFLNSEAKWVTPIHISNNLQAEQAANMGAGIVEYVAEEVDKLLAIVNLFQGKTKRSKKKKKKKKSSGRSSTSSKSKAKTTAKTKTKITPKPTVQKDDEQFTYVATLKPLHIRKGFVNMTPHHWPFFAKSARSGSREVTVCYEGNIDQDSSVWRLQPTDMARLVLSDTAQQWLEDTFDAEDRVRIVAAKLSDEEIQVTLTVSE